MVVAEGALLEQQLGEIETAKKASEVQSASSSSVASIRFT